MTTLPEEAVKAACDAYKLEDGHLSGIGMMRALEAAAPHLAAVRVKKLEWGNARITEDGREAEDAESPVGRYIATDTGWFLLGRTGYEVERGLYQSKAAAQADFEARILSALEPSAARELALEALRSAEQFIENGFEFGFIRKPDEGDPALETLPKIKAAIRALSSPDHIADAGKVEGDGCKSEREKYLEEVLRPFSEIAGELFAANFNNDDVVFTLNRKTANGSKLSYQMTAKAFFEASAVLGGKSS
ncbi:hypothetical protein [Brucella intermedia]|uniref:hypothetical protein n=1 Tax=Brucella intermedia TaxID=94625 RepID=UPI00165D1F6B|nr:hypothetical protein [Brucella intermedia]QNQ39370.1 hypothetical protein IAR37_08255 [Brucella intermedia]